MERNRRLTLRLCDILIIFVSVYLSHLIVLGLFSETISLDQNSCTAPYSVTFLTGCLVMVSVHAVLLNLFRIYEIDYKLPRIEELAQILRSSTTASLFLILVALIPGIRGFWTYLTIALLPVSVILLSSWHRLYRHITGEERNVSDLEVPIGETFPPVLSGLSSVLKRSIDMILSLILLVALLPFCIVCCIASAVESGLPVLYSQIRYGRKSKPFRMLKLRSMEKGSDAQKGELSDLNEASIPLFKVRRDPRLTNVGRFMRRWSLDEIPQLLNVICGSMSLVGPRPPLPEEVEEYNKEHLNRMTILPGLSGAWQVLGRSELSFSEMMALDLYYIRNWSIWLDLSIILLTPEAVILGRGAY